MQKIPTVFKRDFENNNGRYVTDEVNPECQWVLDGEGVATRKYDGTCMMFDGERWWARREVKFDKLEPDNFVLLNFDVGTGKKMGWEPIEQSSFYKFFIEAFEFAVAVGKLYKISLGFPAGTYELCGPKINKNPEGYLGHVLLAHDKAERPDFIGDTRSYEGMRSLFVKDFGGRRGWEGLVWHHPDGRMAKLKVRDFPNEQ